MVQIRLLALAALTVALTLVVAPARAHALSRTFFGVQAWSLPGSKDFTRIGHARIGTFRAQINWDGVEPTPGARNWGQVDALFTRASKSNVTVLPYLLGSPSFAASRPPYPPMTSNGRSHWVSFVHDFVARYGRNGSFWSSHPGLRKRPPKGLQVWNEPNFRGYWNNHPNARQYEQFVAESKLAARSADSKIKIVLAGFPETRLGIRGTRYLKQLYAVPGARSTFDAVAVHPYASNYRGVIGAIKRTRRTMRAHGDRRKQVWVTELGWATGGKVSGGTRKFKTSRRGQASRLSTTFRALKRYRRRYRIGVVVWFSYKDRSPMRGERNWWAINTGLFTRRGKAKPSWRAYKRVTH
jgi:hypothetical protein